MVYLIGWKGRGVIALPMFVGAVAMTFVVDAIFGKYAILGMSLGFIAAGCACWILGRKWNHNEVLHTFGPLKLETWGKIFLGFGALWLVPGVISAMQGL